MPIHSILIFFHVGSNTGYAIEPLEDTFFNVARTLVGDESKIHFGYINLDKGHPRVLSETFNNIITFDFNSTSKKHLQQVQDYIKKHQIDVAFGFDCPVNNLPSYRYLRKAGIKHFIAYYGAPMSSINSGVKLLLKKIEVALIRHKPDHYIYESYSMADTAVNGRGMNKNHISVVPTGVDVEKYRPDTSNPYYACEKFNIPVGRKLVFYSGHMEKRKGVHIIVKAALELTENRGRDDIHFLITGNKDGEEKCFDELYKGTAAEQFITFGGYCTDLPEIIPSCDIGTIASTGWDSFPRSSLEMQACGLPLVVSNLQGIPEAIEEGKTGYLFEPGNYIEMADKIELLVNDDTLRKTFSDNARQRILDGFTLQHNEDNLVAAIQRVVN